MKFLLFSFALAVTFASCSYRSGSGNIVTQQRTLNEVKAIEAGGPFDVEIVPGSPAKLVVEADDNVIDDIETSSSNGTLRIRMRNAVSYNNIHAKIYLTAPAIRSISSSASAEVDVNGILKSNDKITLKASSGSDIDARVDAPEAEANASSGGEIHVKGRTRILDAQASSGSSINAEDLLTEETKAQTSSGASVHVHASLKLNAQASSGGSVNYRGNPTVSKQESSGGSVSKD